MFCKWCGGNIASSDTRCKRCGKEVPPLSNCGGFYDLVPNARKTTEVRPAQVIPPEKPVQPPVQPVVVERPEPVRSKKKRKESSAGTRVLAVVGWALTVLLLLVVLGKVNQYAGKFNELRNSMQITMDKIDDLTEENKTENVEQEETEPSEIATPVLAEQDVHFLVQFEEEDTTEKMSAACNLGEYKDSTAVTCKWDEQGLVESVVYELKETDTELVLTIDRGTDSRTQSITVSYELDDAVYGSSEELQTCKWQYRFDEETDWEDIPEDVFALEIEEGNVKLSAKAADLQDLVDENEGSLELRCEIVRSNAENGSLTIAVEGIVFYKEAKTKE